MADRPSAGEVVDVLVRVHALQATRPYEPSPQAIPLAALLHDAEASDLERINDAIVRVRRVVYLECQLLARSQVVLRQFHRAPRERCSLHLKERWIVEEDSGRPVRKRRLQDGDDVVWWTAEEGVLQRAILARLLLQVCKCLRLAYDQLIELVVEDGQVGRCHLRHGLAGSCHA